MGRQVAGPCNHHKSCSRRSKFLGIPALPMSETLQGRSLIQRIWPRNLRGKIGKACAGRVKRAGFIDLEAPGGPREGHRSRWGGVLVPLSRSRGRDGPLERVARWLIVRRRLLCGQWCGSGRAASELPFRPFAERMARVGEDGRLGLGGARRPLEHEGQSLRHLEPRHVADDVDLRIVDRGW